MFANVEMLSGCWLVVSKCTAHPNATGTHRDTHAHSDDNETACFQRAVHQWHDCGSHDNEQVVAIYGPSGKFNTVTHQKLPKKCL